MIDKLHVDLSGAPQTMLATLYARALDAAAPKPMLGDRYARDLVDRIDYDWTRTAITARTAPSVTTRTAHFDAWTRQFLASRPTGSTCTVLHLGCGLDSRYARIDPGPDVEWYDVDYPDVIALRRQLLPEHEHHHLVAASVTDAALLADVPADRPTLLLGEGLTMYLTRDEGTALLRRVVDRFPSGELQFDAFSTFGIRMQWSNRVVRRAGAKLHWGIDGPDDILDAVPGTRLLAWLSVFDSASFRALPGAYRVMGAVMSVAKPMRNMAQYHRYAF